jgi:hypothetical protein
MSQQAVRQSARRSALAAQAVLRKERTDQDRRLDGLAVVVLTALGERDALVRDAEPGARQVLLAMTDDEGLSVREAVEWCGSGVTVGEVTRLRQLAHDRAGHDPVGPPPEGCCSHQRRAPSQIRHRPRRQHPPAAFPPPLWRQSQHRPRRWRSLRPSWYFLWRHKVLPCLYRDQDHRRQAPCCHRGSHLAHYLTVARMNVINPFAFDSQTGLVVSIRLS